MAEDDLTLAILCTEMAVTARSGIHRALCGLAELVRSKSAVSKGDREACQTKSSGSQLYGRISGLEFVYRSDD